MNINMKEYLNLYNNSIEKENREKSIQESTIKQEQDKRVKDTLDIYDLQEQAINNRKRLTSNRILAKKTLLFECLNNLIDKCTKPQLDNSNDGIKKALINNFIEENGVDRLINSFKTKNLVLSEFYRVINTYNDIITEGSCKEDCEDYCIDVDVKKNFYDELNNINVDSLSAAIQTRVSSAVNEFINQNVKDQTELKEVLQKTQEKINNTKSDSIKESYDLIAKSRIADIRGRRKKNVFECVVSSTATSVIKEEALQQKFFTEGKLDIDKVVESVETMYTFLEMVNSAEIIKVDKEYINKMISNLTK